MPTPRPFQAPVGISPLFKWENLGLQSSKAQAARDAAVAAERIRALAKPKPKPAPRMAGVFNRSTVGRVGVPVLGTALNALDASIQLQEGRTPTQVGTNLAASELGGFGGAAVGSLFGPVGTALGGIAGSSIADMLTRDLRKVNARDLDLTDPATLRALAGAQAGGLTLPSPFSSQADVYEKLGEVQTTLSDIERLTGRPAIKPFWQRDLAASQAAVSRPSADQSSAAQPPAPPQNRPVEERHSPVSGVVPPTSTPSPEERTQENDLARFYAKTHMLGSEMARSGELQKRLWESGDMRGMSVEKFMSWVQANPGVAYREAYRRGLLPEEEKAALQ